ncbi:MAG: hypothetical protein PUC36_02535 [Clostridiales bacterium]|nr:hypothetical protein [Clostridiales bacterium]
MKKRLISLFLALALCVGLGAPAFAAETEENDSASMVSAMASSLKKDSLAKNVSLSKNVLTYTLPNSVQAKIIETIGENGVHFFDIYEGDIHDTLSIDNQSGIILLNGKRVTITVTETTSAVPLPAVETLSANAGTVWIYSNTRTTNIEAEDYIKNLSVSVLLTLLENAMPTPFGDMLSAAIDIIDNAVNAPKSKAVSNTRATYYEEHYWAYKYIDKYYNDLAQTKLACIDEHEHWE